MIIYGSLRKALSGSAPGSSTATGQFSKLPFKPSARLGAVSLLATRLRNVLQREQQYLELGVLGLETSCALLLGHHGLFCSSGVALLSEGKQQFLHK